MSHGTRVVRRTRTACAPVRLRRTSARPAATESASGGAGVSERVQRPAVRLARFWARLCASGHLRRIPSIYPAIPLPPVPRFDGGVGSCEIPPQIFGKLFSPRADVSKSHGAYRSSQFPLRDWLLLYAWEAANADFSFYVKFATFQKKTFRRIKRFAGFRPAFENFPQLFKEIQL